MNTRWSRRLFLRGMGGAAIAAPFLSSVAERAARGQGTSVETPKRLIVMFTHYGCVTDRWFPANSHGALTASDFVGTSLEALAPHASKLLLPRGIRAMNEWEPTVTLGQGNDPHTQVVGSYFTCVPVTPHSSDPFNFEQATKFEAKPTAPSLDHVCARQVNVDGAPLFLRVGGTAETPQAAISYSAGEELFPGIGTLAGAFDAIMGQSSAATFVAVRRQNVIDLVRDDLGRLESRDMSLADQHKLEAWKELLYETSGALVAASCTPEVAATLALTDENFGAHASFATDRVTTKITGSLDGADLFSNIAVLAALCDHSRVIFLKYPSNYVYSGLDINMDSDSLAHRIGSGGISGTCVENVNDMIQTVDRYYAAKFAHLVGQLDAFEEGDGTLLDNTATVWFQEFSDGSALNLNNMPIIQAGGCGGYFKTGQAVNLHDGTSDLHRGNSSAACGTTIDAESFKQAGTPVDIGNAPINKYYCNLMNAIGVKAGADGFPLVGGTQEVTHYGMYDDTTDFASGGENPPKINDPGGFDELRANV